MILEPIKLATVGVNVYDTGWHRWWSGARDKGEMSGPDEGNQGKRVCTMYLNIVLRWALVGGQWIVDIWGGRGEGEEETDRL